ncbi:MULTISPECIES: hypothetical protein [Pseudonocardia]|uniref:NifU-like domain protein n=2 Tax=Pseudonocardia TaxID=1847 RepID=A0A1Y2MY19_PSEAH|nr:MULTISPECIES: hypothetical protein [Pseudonocardia]OSY39707.1 hypothetical protein BG845_03305 [Pseudonocardia autotrophica]TDN72837.1 hypothetical protein C8E95_1903 [Pseudonocardia autotrophica]BBG03555.1 hypothetical protein Pdca_47640 [Pseudonocardia autotrophica]GEC28556.1 hypothetical protein PSA01_55850 [Pseudonocardia saturnea]
MTIDHTALEGLRAGLEADDYSMEVTEAGDRLEIRISAGPDACADCLVPKDMMRSVLHSALGVPEEQIDINYPDETLEPGGR